MLPNNSTLTVFYEMFYIVIISVWLYMCLTMFDLFIISFLWYTFIGHRVQFAFNLTSKYLVLPCKTYYILRVDVNYPTSIPLNCIYNYLEQYGFNNKE